jgi:cation transport regulator ChaC
MQVTTYSLYQNPNFAYSETNVMLMDPGNTGVARDGLVNFATNARPSLAATMDFAERILSTAFAIPVGPDYYAKHVRT